jgi:CIC family chloride channel protein
VGEVMQPAQTISPDMPLSQAVERLTAAHENAYPMLDENGLLKGVISLSDLERAIDKQVDGDKPVRELGTPLADLLVAYPDETSGEALKRLSARGLGLLPVVSRQHPDQLLGQVRRNSIVRAYDLALARRSEIELRADRLRERTSGGDFVEFCLEPGSAAVGESLKTLGKRLPPGCVLVSIKRGERVIIPHGDTQFQGDDRVTVFVTEADLDALRACLR